MSALGDIFKVKDLNASVILVILDNISSDNIKLSLYSAPSESYLIEQEPQERLLLELWESTYSLLCRECDLCLSCLSAHKIYYATVSLDYTLQ